MVLNRPLLPSADALVPLPSACSLNIVRLQGSIVGTLLILGDPLGQSYLCVAAETILTHQLLSCSYYQMTTSNWTLTPFIRYNPQLLPNPAPVCPPCCILPSPFACLAPLDIWLAFLTLLFLPMHIQFMTKSCGFLPNKCFIHLVKKIFIDYLHTALS